MRCVEIASAGEMGLPTARNGLIAPEAFDCIKLLCGTGQPRLDARAEDMIQDPEWLKRAAETV